MTSKITPPAVSAETIPRLEKAMGLDACRIIDLPRIENVLGTLSVVEGGTHIPFEIARIYYLYDVPGGAQRGGHAHKCLQQLMIAMSGSFDVVLDDGVSRRRCHMNRSYYGLYVSNMIWRELDNFSSGAVCLVLASAHYDESDYYRNYDEFSRVVKEGR